VVYCECIVLRCGAKAAAYFDVDDLNDPRAVSRLERLEKEKNDKLLMDDGDEVTAVS
jgi:hypothetical protein